VGLKVIYRYTASISCTRLTASVVVLKKFIFSWGINNVKTDAARGRKTSKESMYWAIKYK
jgi:hypothetical protein